MRRGTAVLLVLAAAGATASATSPARLHPARGPAFVPRLGDWEGVADGFNASFSLIRYPPGTRYTGYAPYAVPYLVEVHPTACPPPADGSSSDSVLGSPSVPTIISRQGGFGAGPQTVGVISAPSRATVRTPFHSNQRCENLVWHMHPAHRLPVRDGTWKVVQADGVRYRVTVAGGGRLARGFPPPNISAVCNGSPGSIGFGTFEVFIQPARRATRRVFADPHNTVDFTLSFTSASTATGRFDATGEGCTPQSLTLRAYRAGS